MSASLRSAGIKSGDGLGDFMKFTTDDAPDGDPTTSGAAESEAVREQGTGVSHAAGVRPSTRYYGAHSTGIH